MKELGIKPFNVPERNIHIIPDKLYKQIEISGKNTLAATLPNMQAIILNAERILHPFDRVRTIFHEIIHLKSYLSIEANQNAYELYRIGFSIIKKTERIGRYALFSGLNEAIVSEIEKRYSLKIIKSNKFLKNEYQWMLSKEAQELKEKISKEKKIEIDEIFFVGKDKEEEFFKVYSYYDQRKVLNYIVDVLYKDNPEKFKSRDEVMKLFFKSNFDGKLIEIGKLIEKSFGKGSFRIIGMMTDTDQNSCKLVMNYLTKNRRINKNK